MITLKKRAEFLALRGGARRATPSFVLEARPRRVLPGAPVTATTTDGAPSRATRAIIPPDAARFGFTVTKKLGNAVVRNRIKRRLRALCQALSPSDTVPGCDYVVVARRAALVRPHAELQKDMSTALDSVNRGLLRQLQTQPRSSGASDGGRTIRTHE